jgi:hypothetical protein
MEKFIKRVALFIPAVISITLMIVVLIKIPEAKTTTQAMEIKMDSLIGIVGVAVSVWIGLNIYNVIEKTEFEKLIESNKKLETKVNDLIEEAEKSNKEFQDKIEKSNKEFQESLTRLAFSDCSIAIKKENIEGITEDEIYQDIRDVISRYSKDKNLLILINRAYRDTSNRNDILLEIELKSNKELINSGYLNEIVDNIKGFMKVYRDIDIKIINYINLSATFSA